MKDGNACGFIGKESHGDARLVDAVHAHAFAIKLKEVVDI
jgi:hypothetical protein